MCRSIKVLRKQDQPATPEEVNAAALQFVRKISGYHHPSQANREAFELAIAEIAGASQRLLGRIASPAGRAVRKRESTGDETGSLVRPSPVPGR